MPHYDSKTGRSDKAITVFWQTLAPERENETREDLAKTRPQEFEKAVLAEMPVLYRVARRLGSGAEEAEDLVQAAVFKAFQKWHQFDGRYLRSWLVRILRNERLAVLRVYQPDFEPDGLSDEAVVEEGFWSTVETRLEADRIIREMDYLSEPYRLAIQLCDVEQMTYEEAAEAMDVPVGTVRSRLFRARVELRRRLGGEA